METQTLSAEVRELCGKGPARQLRMRGLIPAIYYGPGTEPVKLTVSPSSLARILGGEYARNQLIELSYGGGNHLALVRDLAVDPASRELLHADFYAVSKERKVETSVPFLTQGRSVGVQRGGSIRKLFRDLPVRAFPQDVPASITLDVGPLDIGEIVRVEDLPLPAGVEVTFAPNRRVLTVEAKEKKVEEEETAAPA
jgi:large subunit ribosomal protein L25